MCVFFIFFLLTFLCSVKWITAFVLHVRFNPHSKPNSPDPVFCSKTKQSPVDGELQIDSPFFDGFGEFDFLLKKLAQLN